MHTKRERLRPLRSVAAAALAAVITAGAVYSVAAAVNTADAPTDVAAKTQTVIGDATEPSADYDTYRVKIKHNGETHVVNVEGSTVADALKSMQIPLEYDEVVEPKLKSKLSDNMTVKIYEGKKMPITADGKTDTLYVPNGNVCKVLNSLDYKLSDDDILNVDKNSNIEAADNIIISRVKYVTETESKAVDFDTITKETDELEKGETKTATEGKKGEVIITKRTKLIDGKAAEVKTVSEKTVKEPVDRVILKGADPANLSGAAGTFTDASGKKVAYTAVHTGSGTAYTAPSGALAATGVAAYHGGVAVNPNIIPYGSKLYIASTDGSFIYGYATAVDTGGALMSGTAIVDCFYNTYDECVNFGRRNVNVYVIG